MMLEIRGVQMRVLIGCEESGIVAQAFRDRGHDAWSCDVVPSAACNKACPKGGACDLHGHYRGDVRDLLTPGAWDLGVFFPPCTHLAVSGARWFGEKRKEQAEALSFVRLLLDAPIPRIALENPISIISSRIRKPDQIIQPWQFGHGETKATCLWLKGLPLLKPTKIVKGREARVWKMAPGPNRARDRSRTLQGVADAMAEQWGK